MQTQEIPRDQWQPFFAGFSRDHNGEHVTVEILDPTEGDQTEVSQWPLLGITAEIDRGDAPSIEVILGEPGRHASHTVPDPSHVRVARTDDGHDAAIEIEAHGGITTLLRFGAENTGA